jgi:hypothetical protein
MAQRTANIGREAVRLLQRSSASVGSCIPRHQKRSQPFRLTRMSTEATAACLRRFTQVRLEEFDGFVGGLFVGEKAIDLPERAQVAVTHLVELRKTMAAICDLVDRDPLEADRERLQITFAHLRDLNRIMETEIKEAVLSYTRARRQMLDLVSTARSTIHWCQLQTRTGCARRCSRLTRCTQPRACRGKR